MFRKLKEKVIGCAKKKWWQVIELLRKMGFGNFQKLIFFCEMIVDLIEKC